MDINYNGEDEQYDTVNNGQFGRFAEGDCGKI